MAASIRIIIKALVVGRRTHVQLYQLTKSKHDKMVLTDHNRVCKKQQPKQLSWVMLNISSLIIFAATILTHDPLCPGRVRDRVRDRVRVRDTIRVMDKVWDRVRVRCKYKQKIKLLE